MRVLSVHDAIVAACLLSLWNLQSLYLAVSCGEYPRCPSTCRAAQAFAFSSSTRLQPDLTRSIMESQASLHPSLGSIEEACVCQSDHERCWAEPHCRIASPRQPMTCLYHSPLAEGRTDPFFPPTMDSPLAYIAGQGQQVVPHVQPTSPTRPEPTSDPAGSSGRESAWCRHTLKPVRAGSPKIMRRFFHPAYPISLVTGGQLS